MSIKEKKTRYSQLKPDSNDKENLSTAYYEKNELGQLLIWPPTTPGTPRIPINISDILGHSGIWRLIAEWLTSIAIQCTIGTTRTSYYAIRSFSKYLQDSNLHGISVEEISIITARKYISWLDDPNSTSHPPLNETTKKSHYAYFTKLIKFAKASKGHKVNISLGRIPRSPWRPNSRNVTVAISAEDLSRVYAECFSEVVEIMKNHKDLQTIEQHLPQNPLAYLDMTVKDLKNNKNLQLAILAQLYPSGPLPPRKELRKSHSIFKKIYTGEDQILGGYTCLIPAFHPTPRSLVPFILMLTMQFSSNTTSILTAQRQEFSKISLLGTPRILWRYPKGRAGREQKHSCVIDGSPDNPDTLIKFLDAWSKRLRDSAPSHLKDRVFLYKLTSGPSVSQTSSYGGIGKYSADNSITWTSHLKNFLIEHKLPPLSIRNIRMSILDLVDHLSDGDIRARQALAQHRTIETTNKSYTSDAVKKRNEDRLAEAIVQRDRWWKSSSKIDKRGREKTEDLGAATPGWHCINPLQSPIQDQRAGELCQAYGHCPICPMAQLKAEDPYSAARVVQLRKMIVDSADQLPAERWISCWQPVLKALDTNWLPAIANNILTLSKKIPLSPLPPLE